MGKKPIPPKAAQKEAKRLRERERRASKKDSEKAADADKTRRRRDSDEYRERQAQVMRQRRVKLAQDRARALLQQSDKGTNAAPVSSIHDNMNTAPHHQHIGVHKCKHALAASVLFFCPCCACWSSLHAYLRAI